MRFSLQHRVGAMALRSVSLKYFGRAEFVATTQSSGLPNWRDIVKAEESTNIIAISCHHLFGDDKNIWKWEYDTGLRGEETG